MIDLFGQEGEIWISTGGVDAKIPLAPALILFGPNDAGKTNVLRAITSLVRGQPTPPRDPALDQALEAGMNLTLDLERQDHRALLLGVARRLGQATFQLKDSINSSRKREIRLERRSGEDTWSLHDDDATEADLLVQSLRDVVLEWAAPLRSAARSSSAPSAASRRTRPTSRRAPSSTASAPNAKRSCQPDRAAGLGPRK